MNMGIVAGLIKALAPGVDPQVIEQAVTDWLDDHPEATTTVEDGSITEAKLAQDVLAELGEIDGLKEAIENVEDDVDDIKDDLGLSGQYIDLGTDYPLVITDHVGAEVTLEFTIAQKYWAVGKNLCPSASETFVQYKKLTLPCPLPAGTYKFSCTATSTDTDKTVCAVLASYNGTTVVNSVSFLRNERKSVTLSAASQFNELVFYASDNYARGAGDTATFSNIQLELGGTMTDYVAYDGVADDVSTTNEVTITANPTTVYSDDGSDIHGSIGNASQPVIPQLTTDVANIKSNDSFMESVLCNRLMALGKKSNFGWGTYPKVILTLRVDDLRTDVDKVAKIIAGDYSFPVVIGACVKELNKSVTGISDPSEKIGDTRLEVCQWVQEHGGEIVVHPDETVTSADYSAVKTLFIDAKKTLESNGLHIRGTAVANSNPDATLKAGLDPYLYGFFDYADNYGSIAPYTGITTDMIVGFDDATEFETWLDAKTASETKVWRTIVMHQIGDDMTEQKLTDILDIIQTNVTAGKVAVMLWSEVFDTYGT